jgi:TadE-like protein
MWSFLIKFSRDRKGGALFEFALIAVLMLSTSLAAVEFSYLYFQWNSASKAVQLGARIAAVSDPVSSDLKTLTGLEGGALPGDPMPYFERVCDGKTASCTNGGTYDAGAMNVLLNGSGGISSGGNGDPVVHAVPGMRDILPQLKAENVVVKYVYSGLGFAGRPGGPVPTIVVELQGLTFEFVMIDKLFGFTSIQLPTFRTTITGEDLSTAAN